MSPAVSQPVRLADLWGIEPEPERPWRPEPVDLCDWAAEHFYIPAGGTIRLLPHQKCVLRYALTRSPDGRFPFTTIIYSTIKQSGKSTAAALVARWFAETQTLLATIDAVGNDARQARERSFRELRRSIELTPGYVPGKDVLPGRWRVLERSMECLSSGTVVEALAVDARGEAGGKPALSIWTELWGFEYEAAQRFWDELSPVPTVPDSIRLVETYAGYDGESDLLRSLYDRGMEGRQLTAGELADAGTRDAPGESREEMLRAFEETGGDPDAPVPVWVNEAASLFMYWDSGPEARRMPWQRGERGDRYYADEEATKLPKAFRRQHHNEWVGAESSFVPLELWDACHDPALGYFDPNVEGKAGKNTPVVLGADAASSGDSFAVVAVTRHPQRHDEVAIRACREWRPPKGGKIDFSGPEAWMRELCQGYNVVQIAYDPYQLEDMMGRLYREGVAWCQAFPQGKDRLVADRRFYDLIVYRRLAHNGDPAMRQHIQNANAKLQKDQDSTLRIVKKAAGRKVDLAVAASMACHRCLYLLL